MKSKQKKLYDVQRMMPFWYCIWCSKGDNNISLFYAGKQSQMIFIVSENNIKILDILFSENYKLHKRFNETYFEDPMQGSCI